MNITKNRVVSIHYLLKGPDGQVLDAALDAEPLVYLQGHENILPGLEDALEGRKPGDSFSIALAADQAYGERDEALVMDIPRTQFENAEAIEEGMRFEVPSEDGYGIVRVVKVKDEAITVDGNHPLAGQDLRFDVTIAAVREATADELAHGHIHDERHHSACGSCGDCGSGCCGHNH